MLHHRKSFIIAGLLLSLSLLSPFSNHRNPPAVLAEETSTTATQTNQDVAQQPLYRLYHPELRVHLYTTDTNEYNILSTRGWNQEGVAWYIASTNGEPVYRLYHPELRVHLYTKDTNEYTTLANRGWNQEGIAYNSYGEIPIYRLYHPGLRVHLYTTDANEYSVLATRGWNQEGIAFYGTGFGVRVAQQVNHNNTFYPSCAVARAAGVTPIHKGQPGYGSHLDRDGDGIACE